MRKANEILNEILNKRGISSTEDISEFLSAKPQKTYDPFLLLNMKAGVDLILSEIDAGTKICIYGDYDADGVTSVCALFSVISELTDKLTYYIPSRIGEGYGLNKEAISTLREKDVGLLITVDCGSVSYEEVELAKSIGMKVIVTDHHSIDDVKADCILINPKQKECGYPFKELAGCGVAFKLAQALQQRTGLPKRVINDVLDLIAIGTVGDIVSLTDENRTLVKYGLNKINAGNRKALKKLSEAISLPWIKSENIAFGIAPHINAAGRMASAYEAVDLFMAAEDDLIDEQVKKLIHFNDQRKAKQEDAYLECQKFISGDENFIILNMPELHEGIGGIVAGKIKETMGRPVIIMTPAAEGCLKGTGRSIPDVDIYALLKRHGTLFERFGGHKSACGFLMKEDKLPEFQQAINEDINCLLEKDPQLFDTEIRWDVSINAEEVTVALAKELERLEPFGQENPKPAFLIRNVLPFQPKFMGAEETHVRFTALSSSGGRASCVLFQRAQEKKDIICGSKTIDIIGTINLKKWRDRENVQLIAEEIVLCK